MASDCHKDNFIRLVDVVDPARGASPAVAADQAGTAPVNEASPDMEADRDRVGFGSGKGWGGDYCSCGKSGGCSKDDDGYYHYYGKSSIVGVGKAVLTSRTQRWDRYLHSREVLMQGAPGEGLTWRCMMLAMETHLFLSLFLSGCTPWPT